MSSREAGGKPVNGVSTFTDPSSKGKDIASVDELNHGRANMGLEAKDDGREVARKPINRAAPKPFFSQNFNIKPWGNQNNTGSGKAPANAWAPQTGRGNARHPPSSNRHMPAVIPPPLEHGWKWGEAQKGNNSILHTVHVEDGYVNVDEVGDDYDDDEDEIDESDDDLLSDDSDSDTSEKSHETRKKSRWFIAFFEKLDSLNVEQINEPERQWHCPSCQGGPGALDWYRGLQPLMTHAKTKGSKRVSLHRNFAELLDEELRRKGTSVVPAGEAFGKWRGLNDVKDREIVWPPMVVVMNTRLEKDDNDKWLGMGGQELLDYFSSYAAVKARHSYGPQGHRGMSILVFEATAVGYLEAERLSKHFEAHGTDKEAWNRHRVPFYPGGQRQLYGYMAEKEDMDFFNRHSHGKSKLRFELRSYLKMVVNQMKQMSEDNQKLILFKEKVAKEKRHSKALKESYSLVAEKLRRTEEENRIVRQRTKLHHEQNKEEMDYQEQFFKDQIRIIEELRNAKEVNFEQIQQKEREKVKHHSREDQIEAFIKSQNKEMVEFAGEREKLIKVHDEKMAELEKRYWKEKIELEREFDSEFTQLMEKYAPH